MQSVKRTIEEVDILSLVSAVRFHGLGFLCGLPSSELLGYLQSSAGADCF
jgi:hypothetical protein